jgi:hypothetical protein
MKTDKFTNPARDQEGPFLHHLAPPVPSSIDQGPRQRDSVSGMIMTNRERYYQWEISLHRTPEALFVLPGGDDSRRLPTSASQVLNPALDSLVPRERTDIVNNPKHKFLGVIINANKQGVVHDIDACRNLVSFQMARGVCACRARGGGMEQGGSLEALLVSQ